MNYESWVFLSIGNLYGSGPAHYVGFSFKLPKFSKLNKNGFGRPVKIFSMYHFVAPYQNMLATNVLHCLYKCSFFSIFYTSEPKQCRGHFYIYVDCRNQIGKLANQPVKSCRQQRLSVKGTCPAELK